MNDDGKFDADARALLRKAKSEFVLVIVGPPGNGFSIAALSPEVLRGVPELLRYLADKIEADTSKRRWSVERL